MAWVGRDMMGVGFWCGGHFGDIIISTEYFVFCYTLKVMGGGYMDIYMPTKEFLGGGN